MPPHHVKVPGPRGWRGWRGGGGPRGWVVWDPPPSAAELLKGALESRGPCRRAHTRGLVLARVILIFFCRFFMYWFLFLTFCMLRCRMSLKSMHTRSLLILSCAAEDTAHGPTARNTPNRPAAN